MPNLRLQIQSGVARCLTATLMISLWGCNGLASLQNNLAPDPKLTEPATSGEPVVEKPGESKANLPKDFPVYPKAKAQSTQQTKERGIVSTWTTADPIDLVYEFYQKELTAKQWQISSQPSESEPRLVAKQAQTTVMIEVEPNQDKQQPGVAIFTISLSDTTSSSVPSKSPSSTTSPSPTTKTPIDNRSLPSANGDYVADLAQLGILSSTDTVSRGVTRREYVRWLVAAYNRIHSTKPTQQLKLATTDAKPIFSDVPTTHPDFPSIQGLAEAGLIPSPLSGDTTNVLFRPDVPLTREQLILWKVPLDTRQALPAASLDAVKQTWGFQDAAKVDSKALRAILADFQNGDQSNIRRVFGYTTLFQPKKTVNLGEVAATIWFFGANSDGLSARDAAAIAEPKI